VVEVALHIAHALADPRPRRGIERFAAMRRAPVLDHLRKHALDFAAPFVRGALSRRYADEAEAGREPLRARKLIQGGNEKALGEVAGSAEDHHRAGRCGSVHSGAYASW